MQYKFLAAGAALMFSSFLSAQTLVSLDGVGISADELEQAMKTLVPENQQESLTMKEQNVRSFMLDILTYKRMAAEAEKYKLDQQPATRAKLDFERNKILTTALIDDYVNKAKEPNLEALARELYLTNKSEYKSPEQVQARHILIAVNDERSDEQALKLATELSAKAKQLAKAGKDVEFVGLVLEHSDDPSAERNGGHLGSFTRGVMVPEFTEAAFAMKKNEISDPVKTKFGYHVIQLLDRQAPQDLKFDEVKEQLIEDARATFRAQKQSEIVGVFQGNPDTKIDEAALKAFLDKVQKPYREK